MLGVSFRSEYQLAHKINVRLNAVVSQGPAKRRPVPPRNPGVRDLVGGKRCWSSPRKVDDLKQGFRGWHERGYLPHRDQLGLTQFVTFHLADSFPTALRSEWAYLAEIEDSAQRRKQYEVYLDKGRGKCWLRKSGIASLVEENLLNHSGCCGPQGRAPDAFRYELRAWCIMPNHVHILFKTGNVSMSEIVGAWKTHTGRLANKLLHRRGAFWAEDYFDTFMRDAEHEQRTIRYIEDNPPKAKLVLDPKKWRWSSARFQDEFGRLKLPVNASGPRPCGPQQHTNDKKQSPLSQTEIR
jgi:REP element-mobilizing transposase RayT